MKSFLKQFSSFHRTPEEQHRTTSLGLPALHDLEKAVRVLLSPPHIEYMRELDAETENDPQYVFNHEFSVGVKVQNILLSEGIRWKPEVMRLHWNRALNIALHKIREESSSH